MIIDTAYIVSSHFSPERDSYPHSGLLSQTQLWINLYVSHVEINIAQTYEICSYIERHELIEIYYFRTKTKDLDEL